MDRLENYRNAIKAVLHEYVQLCRRNRPVETIAICDTETDNYLLMNVGWKPNDRIHSIVVHLRILDGKIHVEWNGTEDLIEDLGDRGIPESEFVPASPERYRPTEVAKTSELTTS